MKEKIDIDSWSRRDQYKFFSSFVNPYASLTSPINVDKIVKYSKNNNISFYGIMSYVVLKSINDIEEFKYVLENDGIYKYEKVNASFTVLTENNDLHFSRVAEFNNFNKFISDFELLKNEAENNDVIEYEDCYNKIYITCMPWIRITSLTNPINYNDIDSVPRICWGKYFLDNNKYMIDLSGEFNHAFVDGYHMSKFFVCVQNNIDNFERIIA